MPSLDDKHLQLLVFDSANHAVMAGAVSPQLAQFTFQSLAKPAGVISPRYMLVQIGEDTHSSLWSHLPHLFDGGISELIVPVHV